MASEQPPQHAFISYVREDSEQVDQIQELLEEAGIRVWRDTADLGPGEEWALKIRQAITNDSLVFIACFSSNSAGRDTTYQNEELLLAIEQFRRRQPDHPWLIPLRLSDCTLPPFDLGANRTLDSLQRVDLFGAEREKNVARLISSVLRLQGRRAQLADAPAPAPLLDPVAKVKGALLQPSRQIELEDYVLGLAEDAADACADLEIFPINSDQLTTGADGVRLLVKQTERYWDVLDPLLKALITGCTWGQPQHGEIWTRAVERVVNASEAIQTGPSTLVHLRRFPVLALLYSSGLAAVDRKNFAGLKAVAIDAQVRRDGDLKPLIGAANVWRTFEHADVAATVLARQADDEDVGEEVLEALLAGRKGKRHTPVSDYLCARLRPLVATTILDDERYAETFDRLEVLLNALAEDAKAQAESEHRYLDGAWFGRMLWRYRRRGTPIERQMLNEVQAEGHNWAPVTAGLFGGSRDRAEAALETLTQEAQQARRHLR